jgi:hypothetical protein
MEFPPDLGYMQPLRKLRLVHAVQIATVLVLLRCIGSSFPRSFWPTRTWAGSKGRQLCTSVMPVCNTLSLSNATACELLLDALAAAPPRRRRRPTIPRLIHQSWKDSKLPEHFARWSQSWRDANPGWEYRLWTDDDNRRLVSQRFPWLLRVYDALPVPVMRADTARYLYMYTHGGVYADLDTFALRSTENLTEAAAAGGAGALVALMSGDVDYPHNIPNAWMASQPGHPFWLFLAKTIKEAAGAELEEDKSGGEMKAEEATGPVALKRAYDTWRCVLGDADADVAALPAGYVFVSDWHDEEARIRFDGVCNGTRITSPIVRRRCLAAYPNAHVLTWWTHSWEVPWWEKEGTADQDERS